MYQALYRKWRPKVFEDVAGQPHVTITLKNEIQAGRIGHAYLFTGSRGTGKTTCAKILAKAVNCLHPVNGDPCNECDNCKGIESGTILDVVEIDAASNNGVDNIRDLREEAGFTPASAKYRVYIIDEAHMLSTGAFNALLKTLEEPPAYVIFILATTEVHKIPATILSRCQRFDFRRIPVYDIASRIKVVAAGEKLEIDDDASELIAKIADGGLRDALSLLDQCAAPGGKIDLDVVSKAAGLSDRAYIYEMSGAVSKNDSAAALQLIDRLYTSSKDVGRLCEELISHFRSLMIIKSVKDAQSILNCTESELQKLRKAAEGFSAESLLHILESLQDTLERLHHSSSRRVELEMSVMRICSPALDTSPAALLRRISALEEKLRYGAPVPASLKEETNQAADIPEKAAAQPPKPAERAPEPDPDDNAADEPLACWPEILESLGSLDAPLCGVLNASSAVVRGSHVLVDAQNSMFVNLIRQQSHQKSLVEAIRRVTGKPYKVGIFKKSLGDGIPQKNSEGEAAMDSMDEIAKLAQAGGVPVHEK